MTATINIGVKTAALPHNIDTLVTIDDRTEPGKVRIVGKALGMSQEGTISPDDARNLADHLWDIAEQAELAKKTA